MIKRFIIRWALKQLKPLLPVIYKKNYEQIGKYGIADIMENEFTKELAIFID